MIWTGLDIATALSDALEKRPGSSPIYFLCSAHTHSLCLSLIEMAEINVPSSHVFVVPDGENAKTLSTCESIYLWLQSAGALRNALLINVGGGALCDVGGFCAATYLRGITFWNIPTTLLAMVDASVGGKNGINLLHHKNYIGTFQQPEKVFVSPHWLSTLSHPELLSGWAEVIKHGIIAGGKHFQQVIKPLPATSDQQAWLGLIEWNIKLKTRIVESDFVEKGDRKLLNLGHTVGHALESWSHDVKQPISHGCAVAWGLVYETKIAIEASPNRAETQQFYEDLKMLVKSIYDPIPRIEGDITVLMNYIQADKKNENHALLFSLAFAPGDCHYNINIDAEAVVQALNG
ncbi:MAG: 3-dehydroquinate synthase [Bacteroidota bacterium]